MSNFDPQAKAISFAFKQIAREVGRIAEILGARDDLNNDVPKNWPLNMSADEFEAQCLEMHHHYSAIAEGSDEEKPVEGFISFADFQAGRRGVDDLGAAINADLDGVRPGYAYPGNLYIEYVTTLWSKAHERGRYMLILKNDDWISDDLTLLERKLYEFGIDEGLLKK